MAIYALTKLPKALWHTLRPKGPGNLSDEYVLPYAKPRLENSHHLY